MTTTRLGFRSLFSRLFISVFLALLIFAISMFLWVQVVHNNSDTLKNRAIARQIASQIEPFLSQAQTHFDNNNLLQARFSLVVVKKTFDIFDESLNAKIGLYSPDRQLILQTNNSYLPEFLHRKSTWLDDMTPTLWGSPPNYVQVTTASGFTIYYESRHPPPVSRLSGVFNFFTGTVLLFAIMTAVLWAIAKNMTHRLNAMSKQMAKMGDGDFSVRVKPQGNDEIAFLAHGFNQAAQKIEQLINANSLLLAHASHEFRTPITRMRLQTEMLAMLGDSLPDCQSAQLDKRLSAINRDLTGLNDLIESILLVSRLDAGHALEQMQATDLYDIISQECQHFSQVRLFGESVTVLAQPKLITHLIRNLLNNAILHGIPPISVYVYGCQTSDETNIIPSELLSTNAIAHSDDSDNNNPTSHPIQPSTAKPSTNALANDNKTVNSPNTELNDNNLTNDDNLANAKSSAIEPSNTQTTAHPAESGDKANKSLFARFKKPTPPKDPAFAVLAVIDQGSGIPKDKQEAIFSPFVRLKQEKKGSGLGLSLVAQIVQAHGGQISTDTWQGNTRFLVVFPIKSTQAQPPNPYAKKDKL